jgi:hypothetical protein
MDVDNGAKANAPAEASKAGSGTVPAGMKFTKTKKDKADKVR